MRNGFQIFDADTHVRPDADLLEPHLSTEALARLGQFDQYRVKNKEGAVTFLMGARHYKRRLGPPMMKLPRIKIICGAIRGISMASLTTL